MKSKIALKVLILSCSVIIILNLLVGYLLSRQAYNNVLLCYENDTKTTLKSIIANLDTNAFEEMIETHQMDSPSFTNLHDYLNNIKHNTNILYIYLLTYDQKIPFYVVDGDDFENDTFCNYGEPFLTEEELSDYKDCYDRLQNNEFIIYDFEADSDFGQLFSVEAPVFNKENKFIGSLVIDVQANDLFTQAAAYRNRTFALVVISAIIAAILVYIIINSILGKSFIHLSKIIEATSNFNFRDLTLGQSLSTRHDEIGTITTMLINMRKKLHEQAISINKSATVVEQTIEQVNNQLAISDETTQQINASIEALAEGINEQVADTNSSYEMLTLLSERIETLNNHIYNIDQIISNTKSQEIHHLNKLSALNETINHNTTLSSDVENNINTLAAHSKEIENIVNVIANITKQTTLLSLNAAIEAARAGEAGRGFSIVSDEISSLSTDTYQSTEEIRNVISIIISDIQSATSTISSLIDSNYQVSQDTKKVSDVFNDTLKQIDEITTLTHEISHFAVEINDYKNRVTATTQKLTGQAQEYSSITQEIAATTELESEKSRNLMLLATNLKETSVHLNELISEYQL